MKINDDLVPVVVSATEPTGHNRKKIWKQHSNNSLDLKNGTYAANGITIVVNNGIATLSGTATEITLINVPLNKSIMLESNNSYVINAFNTKKMEDTGCTIRPTSSLPNWQADFSSLNASKRQLINSDINLTSIYIRTGAGITYPSNFIIKPMLTKSFTPIEYEPFLEDEEYILNKGNIYDLCKSAEDSKIEDRLIQCGLYRGTYDLLTLPKTITNANNKIQLELRIHFRQQLELLFPLDSSRYTRKYILLCDANTDNNRCTLSIEDITLLTFLIWGEQSSNQTRTEFTDITSQINSLGYGHLKVYAQTAGWAYINRAYILVIDYPKF